MKTIKIDGKEYEFINEAGEITLGQHSELLKIIAEKEVVKEYKEFGATGEKQGTKIEVELEEVEQSEEFKQSKYNKIVALLSDIPLEILEDYPQIASVVIDSIDFSVIVQKDKKVRKELKIGSDRYLVLEPSKGEFQRWSDVERYIKMLGNWAVLLVYSDKIVKRRSKYNRYFPDFDYKTRYLSSLLYKEWGSTVEYLLKQIANIKESYYYIYKCSDWGDKASKDKAELSDVFGWELTIANLAESGVFGTLKDVRNENVLDVLEYVNMQTAKNRAEWIEYQRTKKKK